MHKSFIFGLLLTYMGLLYVPYKAVEAQEIEKFTMDEIETIRADILDKSNIYRKKHGLKPFERIQEIENSAQQWADTLASHNFFEHDDEIMDSYGQNIYTCSPFMHVGELAVDKWYSELIGLQRCSNERELYGQRYVARNVIQLLWIGTTQMGAGAAKSSDGKKYYVVVNYYPSGSIKNHYKENLPEIKQADIDQELKNLEESRKALAGKSSMSNFGPGVHKYPGWQSTLHDD